jgi:dihydrofolate synthase/folylpolyglutamate synthase
VDIEQIAKGLSQVSLKGRLQKVSHSPDIWVDVAHNGHAAQSLAQWLLTQKQDQGKTHAVFSMLVDKDIDLVVNTLQSCIDTWHVFALEGSRALPLEQLVSTLKNSVSDTTIYQYDDLKSALQGAISMSTKPDKVVAFGSFLVVSGVLEHLSPSTY